MARDALVVGINTYQYSGLPNLNSPALDAEAIAVLLEQYGDFRVTRLPEAINPEKQPYIAQGLELGLDNLEKALEKLFMPKGRSIPDTALFYFSGHGLRKQRGVAEGFLASSDCDPQKSFWGLSLRWLRELLAESSIKQQIVLLDCCHSGELFNFNEANPGDRGLARDRCFIAASREFEAAQASLDSEYSVFTKVLLEGLKPTGIANITNLSLVNYINQNWGNGTQRPIYSNFGEPIILTSLSKQSFFSDNSSNLITSKKTENLIETLVVSQFGRGDYYTILEAIIAAKPGTKILVQEGVYRESLIINKPLEIIGDGKISDIVLDCIDSSCILMKTEIAKIQGLTISSRASLEKNKYFAIKIPQGKLVLEDCDITSHSYSSILISGLRATPIIRNCKIHDSKGSGIVISNNACPIIEKCDIFSNVGINISVSQKAKPTIKNCTIYDRGSLGIGFSDESSGLVEDCDISHNTYANILITGRSNPKIRSCKIHHGKKSGIWIYNYGQGIIENCEIYSNNNYGIYIQGRVNPRIFCCKIFDGAKSGILVDRSAKGIIDDCDITKNNGSGILIKNKSNPFIKKSRINSNKNWAIRSRENGLGRVIDCDLTDNKWGSLKTDSNSKVEERNNTKDNTDINLLNSKPSYFLGELHSQGK
jgi:parallel beta-helix repeat protein